MLQAFSAEPSRPSVVELSGPQLTCYFTITSTTMIITMIIVILTIVMMFLNPDQNLVFRVLLALLVGLRAWTGSYDKGLEGSRAAFQDPESCRFRQL